MVAQSGRFLHLKNENIFIDIFHKDLISNFHFYGFIFAIVHDLCNIYEKVWKVATIFLVF